MRRGAATDMLRKCLTTGRVEATGSVLLVMALQGLHRFDQSLGVTVDLDYDNTGSVVMNNEDPLLCPKHTITVT